MQSRLKELQDEIFSRKRRSKKEWLALDKDVEKAWEEASDEEKQDFLDSGAGDMIGQLLEFM